ncbi:phosphatase PAP2 family protein [Salinarimonas soli]|uniref:Phosphatase PAP2 family protein n=1 Tax=Salinarimonas soli TaxID=1638099 RepID=A0A5B2V9T8_9HYPH|nr:phosphatase PAP2 family protein [Salinarimonas soli]KAA2235152.1 phosphatase PAP2 family protein [Salinarimonas soli]
MMKRLPSPKLAATGTSTGTAKREIGVLVVIALAAAAMLLFLTLVDAVTDARAIPFDRAIILALRNPADLSDPIGPLWFEEVARDITALGGFTILTLITLATVGFLAMSRMTHAAVLVAVAVGGGTVLSTILKSAFDRPRPDLVPHATEVFTASFPSGHAMMSAVTYLTLGALIARLDPNRRVKAFVLALAVVITLLVGASRVYLGVHWPSDVLAGWCVGSIWATLCWLVARRLQRAGQVERVAPRQVEPADGAEKPARHESEPRLVPGAPAAPIPASRLREPAGRGSARPPS